MNRNKKLLNITPVAAAVLLTLPLVMSASAASAPVIDINTPNKAGISYNSADKFNVGKEGVIFNNSTKDINTQLAGMIKGNEKLTSGSASIIINEVSSKNRSNLEGMMEIAGDKAHLIIANPAGITCSGCGFINSQKVTLTTGTLNYSGGKIQSTSVSGGDIVINNGMTSDSPTAILARSAVINGAVKVAGQLDVVLGNNIINYNNNEVDGKVTATGAKAAYSLDVSQIGGMYADKISLVSTESGVGVNNKGIISSTSGNIDINVNGRLLNRNGQINSADQARISLEGALDNVDGQIAANNLINIVNYRYAVDNTRGKLISDKGAAININTSGLNNSEGRISTSGDLHIDNANGTITNSSKTSGAGIYAGNAQIFSNTFQNTNGVVKVDSLVLDSASINNTGAVIDAKNSINISSKGNIDNTQGRIRSTGGDVTLTSNTGTIKNNNSLSANVNDANSLGIIANTGNVTVSATNIENSGQIFADKQIYANVSNSLNNNNGKLISSDNITGIAKVISNNSGVISAKNAVSLSTSAVSTGNTISNSMGAITSEQGDVSLASYSLNTTGGFISGKNVDIKTVGDVNNTTGFISAKNNVSIQAATVNNTNSNDFAKNYGVKFNQPKAEGGIVAQGSVNILASNLSNNNGNVIAKTGTSNIVIEKSLSNERGVISSNGSSKIQTTSLNNNEGKITSADTLDIKTTSLTNGLSASSNSLIQSNNNLNLTVSNSFTNYGSILGNDWVTVKSYGAVTNYNTMKAGNDLVISTSGDVKNYGTMVADKNELSIMTGSGTIYNAKVMTGGKEATFMSNKFVNNAGAVAGSKGELYLSAKTIDNKGTLLGL